MLTTCLTHLRLWSWQPSPHWSLMHLRLWEGYDKITWGLCLSTCSYAHPLHLECGIPCLSQGEATCSIVALAYTDVQLGACACVHACSGSEWKALAHRGQSGCMGRIHIPVIHTSIQCVSREVSCIPAQVYSSLIREYLSSRFNVLPAHFFALTQLTSIMCSISCSTGCSLF